MPALFDLAEKITDGTHYTPINRADGVPFLTVKDMTPTGLDFAGASRISASDFEAARNGGSAPKIGDVLFSKDGTVGKVHVVTEDRNFAVLSSIAIISPRSDIIDSGFLAWTLRNPEVLSMAERRKTGSAVRRIILADLKRLEIPLPSRLEQSRIASVLDQVDRLRRLRRESIEATVSARRAATEQLVAGSHHSIAKLGDLCSRITDGTHQAPRWAEQGVPFLFVSNVTSGVIRYETEKFVSEATYRELTKNSPINVGDILYTAVGSYGIPALVTSDAPFIFQRHIAHLKPRHDLVNSRYLRDVLESPIVRRQADRVARGAAQKTVTLGELSKFAIPLVSLDQQREHETRVLEFDHLLESSLAHLALLDELFASLQHRAFTGQL